MYFSDEIELISKTYTMDGLGQQIEAEATRAVFCDLQSVGGSESTRERQAGIHASARAVVHAEDYDHEAEVNVLTGNAVINAGKYAVYRTYLNGDTVELYLTESVGV